MIVGWGTCSKDAVGQKRDAPDEITVLQLWEERQIVPPLDVTSVSLEKDLYQNIYLPDDGWSIWISDDGEKEILQAFKDHGLSYLTLVYEQHTHSIISKIHITRK